MNTDIIFYLWVSLFGIVVLLFLYYLISRNKTSHNTLSIAKEILGTNIKNSLLTGKFIKGIYKNREITVAESIDGAMSLGMLAARKIQISAQVNQISSEVSNDSKPTPNTYLDGKKVIFGKPSRETLFRITKETKSYSKEELISIFDELIEATEIVERGQI